ncbi:MAG TPA: Asp-tRNA(Asn)/Glu-tRNA(Gln) amidotransferase subunit GatC [Gemmatimonadaceae bacterium]|nr:Asp-tRNA(Asn)/Glu-tRNA(Gln) amidotransferase subunit GatC [Gemmatimonadaceae bacterium]
MSRVSPDDVRRVAALARLELGEERLTAVAAQLDGILSHMEVLRSVDLRTLASGDGEREPTPLRPDVPGSIPLERPREAFAPHTRDGFFLVPRLASHDRGDEE